jgi:hypothetical protein
MDFPMDVLFELGHGVVRFQPVQKKASALCHSQARRSRKKVELAIEKLHEHQGANIEHQRKPRHGFKRLDLILSEKVRG